MNGDGHITALRFLTVQPTLGARYTALIALSPTYSSLSVLPLLAALDHDAPQKREITTQFPGSVQKVSAGHRVMRRPAE